MGKRRKGGRQTYTACITTEYTSPHASCHPSPPDCLIWGQWRCTHTHKHTHLQRHRRLAASCYPSWLSKLKRNHTLAPQTPAHMKKVTLTGSTPVNKGFSYLRDIPQKSKVLTCTPTQREPYVCHVRTLSVRHTCAHTPWPLQQNSQTLKYWLDSLFWGLSGNIKCKPSSLVLHFWHAV